MRVAPAMALAITIAVAQPALGWEHGFDEAAAGLTHWVISRDADGEAELAFYCSSSMPGAVYAQLDTGHPGAGGGLDVKITIETGGSSFGPLTARVGETEGSLIIHTSSAQHETAQAARAVYAGAGLVTVTYDQKTWTFPGASYSDAFGAMLDGCG